MEEDDEHAEEVDMAETVDVIDVTDDFLLLLLLLPLPIASSTTRLMSSDWMQWAVSRAARRICPRFHVGTPSSLCRNSNINFTFSKD